MSLSNYYSTIDLAQHKHVHIALKTSNLCEVERLFKLGVRPCHENCYILAQENENAKFLEFLLECDSKGSNAVNSDGDSLLMLDIKKYYCRHFQLLTDKGADVNYCNDKGFTALHYATMNNNTPLNMIQKLIELGADVNKKLQFSTETSYNDSLKYINDDMDGDTPLLCLLKNNRQQNFYEKVRLLIESNADVNLANKVNLTPLICASRFNSDVEFSNLDLELYKYLLDNGAKAGLSNVNNENAISNLICHSAYDFEIFLKNECVIGAVDLLYEAGDSLFVRNDGHESPLKDLFQNINNHKYLNELIIHFIRLGFNKLSKGYKINSKTEIHPLETILENFFDLYRINKNLFTDIGNLIIYHSSYEFKNFPAVEITTDDYGEFDWECIEVTSWHLDWEIKVSVVGCFVLTVSLDEMKNWLLKLHQQNFDFNSDFPLFVILIQRFIEAESPKTPEGLLDVIDFLLEISYPVFSNNINFKDSNLDTLRTLLQVPDCIWFSAAFGNIDCLKKFLPYWNQHPLAILLLLRPWLESNDFDDRIEKLLLNSIEIILPFLIELGGFLSHGSKIYSLMMRYIYEWKEEGNCKDINEEEINFNPGSIKAAYCRIFLSLKKLQSTPASLQVLCRTIIRENAPVNGNNLPSYLSSLVPYNLKPLISLTQAAVQVI